MASHNNFKNGDQRLSKWKLLAVFVPGSEKFRKIGPKYYYYSKSPQTEESRERLISNCFTKFESQIKIARLYDNQTGELLSIIK